MSSCRRRASINCRQKGGFLLIVDTLCGVFGRFEFVRDPLIRKCMVSSGEMSPRDFEPPDAKAAAQAIVDLLAAELTGAP